MIQPLRPIRRSDRTAKIQRIAHGLGAIGDLFLLKKKRDEEAKQQAIENEMDRRKLAVQELNAQIAAGGLEVDQGNLDARNRALGQAETEFSAEQTRKDQLDAMLKGSDEASKVGLGLAFQKEHQRPPSNDEQMMIDAVVIEKDANIRDQLLVGLFPSLEKASGPKTTAHQQDSAFDLESYLGPVDPETGLSDLSRSVFDMMGGLEFEKIGKTWGFGGEADERGEWPLGWQLWAKLNEAGNFDPDGKMASAKVQMLLEQKYPQPESGSTTAWWSKIHELTFRFLMPDAIARYSVPPVQTATPSPTAPTKEDSNPEDSFLPKSVVPKGVDRVR